jgi:hypothetical protein
VTDRPGSDRFGILVAVLGGLLVALAAVLIIFLVARNDESAETTIAASTTETTGPATTTAAPTTTTSPAETTTAPTTTAATTTVATTITTTSILPFGGDLDPKTGPIQGTPSGHLTDVRAAAHPGYTRVVFDFAAGGIPSYWVGYTDAFTLTVILYPMDDGDPYHAGIFDAVGSHPVSVGAVISVEDSGMGGGSQEWVFDIVVAAQRPFLAGTLADPPRLYVDVGD